MPSGTLPMSMAISIHLHWGCQGLCPPHQFKLHLTQLCSIQLPLLAPQETLYILNFPALANMLLSYKRKPSVFQSLCPPYISLSIFLTVLYTVANIVYPIMTTNCVWGVPMNRPAYMMCNPALYQMQIHQCGYEDQWMLVGSRLVHFLLRKLLGEKTQYQHIIWHVPMQWACM